MTPLNRYKPRDVQRVVENLSLTLRFQFTDEEIKSAFAGLSLPPPSEPVRMYVRKMCIVAIESKMEALCTKFSAVFLAEPKPKDLDAALDSAGYTSSRPFRRALMAALKKQNATQWAQAANISKKRVSLADGERAVWEALQRTYGLKSDMLVPTLLRLFAVVTSTGKINPLEVPYLTSTVTDEQLKRYAQSLNFVVKPPPKSRV